MKPWTFSSGSLILNWLKTLEFQNKRSVGLLPSLRVAKGAFLLLAKASTPEQESHIGNQTGGRVFLFLDTDDF